MIPIYNWGNNQDYAIEINGGGSGNHNNIVIDGNLLHSQVTGGLNMSDKNSASMVVSNNTGEFNYENIYTYSQLPSSGMQAGQKAVIVDCNTSTFHAIAAGSGSVVTPVFYDGANWRVG